MRDSLDGGSLSATLITLSFRETSRCSQQKLPVIRIALAIETQKREFVALLCLTRDELVAAIHQMLDADAK